ncbi:MAG: LD-carboxypeptidase [Lachnospiraceae bacterium]|nr:LD-carboxypeptidase [Lachnospiraceae bacterium]
MRYPEFLQQNGTIAFVAPSFGCATEPYKSGFLRAQENWKKQGFQLELGPNCYVEQGVGISNAPDQCGEELTEYYCRETNDCIISCGGGELMCEILDYVDFDKIRKAAPKWYMGYSDNTNMTFLLTTLCDTASIYGPCASSYGMEPLHQSLEDAMLLLQGCKLTMQGYDMWEKESVKDEEQPYAPYNLTETTVIKYIMPDGRTNIESLSAVTGSNGAKTAGAERPQQNGAAANGGTAGEAPIDFSGRLLGGCMDCLVNLLGTKYDQVTEFTEKYKEDGILWFLEACDLNLMGIRRAMWQMDHAGWFKHSSGFLIGRPLNGMGVEEFGIDHYQAAYEMLRKYNVPVIMDVDIGHLSPMMPLISGAMARVVSDGQEYRVEMELR